MNRSRLFRLLAPLSVVVLASTSLAARPTLWHLHLVRSQPAANDTLRQAPAAIRLWFSSPPEMAITTIHLTSADGKAVPVGPATRDEADSSPVVAPVTGSVAPGSYVVAWRTSAQDGHMSSGTIPFVVH